MIDFMASEEDIIAILQSDLSNLISDSTYPTEGMPHPAGLRHVPPAASSTLS